MRIWYQSMARADSIDSYFKTVQEALAEFAGPDVEIDVHGITRGGGVAEFWRFFEFIDTRDVLSNAIRAEQEGYDAFLIGNIGDPGLYEAREMLNIPVLGLCETTAHVALQMGRTFALISLYRRFNGRIVENLERYRLTDRFTGVYDLEAGVSGLIPAMSAWYDDPAHRKDVLDDFVRASERAVADGAEVLVAAGCVLMNLLAREGVHEVGGAPVLNGTSALVKMGRLAVELRAASGHFTSKAGTFSAPARELLGEIQAAHGYAELEQAVFERRS